MPHDSPGQPPGDDPVPASTYGDQGVFIWRKALHAAADLDDGIRYTLTVLSDYMTPAGTQGRPGYARLAAARRKSERTLREHLKAAEAAGWIVCIERGRRVGTAARSSVYIATLPRAVHARLEEILLPAWGAYDRVAGASQHAPETAGSGASGAAPTGNPALPPGEFPTGDAEMPTGDPPTGNAGVPPENFPTGSAGLPAGDTPTGNSTGPNRQRRAAAHQSVVEIKRDQSSGLTAERIIADATDANPEETAEILRRIIAKHAPALPLAYVRRMAEAGHLAAWLAAVRSGPTAAPDGRSERPATPVPPRYRAPQPPRAPQAGASGPTCPHGQPGGASPDPATGEPTCPICRGHKVACRRGTASCSTCQAIQEAAGPPEPRAVYDEAG